MPHVVTMPDGTIHNFPDEATPEMISSALGLRGAEPAAPVANPKDENVGDTQVTRGQIDDAKAETNDALKSFGVGAMQGIEQLPNIPANLANVAANHLPDSVQKWLEGQGVVRPGEKFHFPTWQQMGQKIASGDLKSPDFSGSPTLSENLYQPKTKAGEYANVVGQTLSANRAFNNPVTNATALTGGISGKVASDLAPDEYKDVAGLLGGLVGGGAKNIAEDAAGGVGSFVKNRTKEEIYPGVNATPNQQKVIGNEIVNASSNPQEFMSRMGLDDNAQPPAVPFVPGSKPTLAESLIHPGVDGDVGDTGITGWQKGVRVNNVEAFNNRRNQNVRAQNEALKNVTQEGDPADVGSFFVRERQRIQKSQDDAVSAAESGVKSKTSAIGQDQSLDDLGSKIRENEITPKLKEDDKAESALWKTVEDHYGSKIVGTPVVDAAKSIMGEINFTKGGEELRPYEQKAISAAGRWDGENETFHDARTLSKTVAAAIRTARADPEAGPQSVRRLTILQKAIDDTLENNINNVEQARQNAADNVKQPSARDRAVKGIPVPEPVPDKFSPAYDETGRTAYQAAKNYTREQRQFYGQPVFSDILSLGKAGQQYRMPDANVPYRIFNQRPTSASDIGEYLSDRGGGDVSTLHDVALAKMRGAGAIDDNGLVNSGRLSSFLRSHKDAIDAVPGLREKISDAGSVQDTYNSRMAERDAAISNFDKSAASKFITQDPDKAVAAAFGGSNSAAKLSELASAVKKDPSAKSGLQKATAQHILENVRKYQAGDTTGLDIATPKSFRTFMSKNDKGLSEIFSPDQKSSLNAVLDDMRRSAINEQSAMMANQSNTTPLKIASDKIQSSVMSKLTKYAGVLGPVGDAAVFLKNALGQRNIATIEQLRLEAALNPDLARVLVSKSAEKITPAIARRIGKALLNGTKQAAGIAMTNPTSR